MGIDLIKGGKRKRTRRTRQKSKDIYLGLLVQLYRFLARRAPCRFNQIVLRRLFMSRINAPHMSLSRIKLYTKKNKDKIVVVVGKILDDIRTLSIPKLSICALRFSQSARNRILKAGGECLTFDQLALRAPTGTGTLLLMGRRNARKARKYFGAAGEKATHTRPYVRSKGRKFERTKRRKMRKSTGFEGIP